MTENHGVGGPIPPPGTRIKIYIKIMLEWIKTHINAQNIFKVNTNFTDKQIIILTSIFLFFLFLTLVLNLFFTKKIKKNPVYKILKNKIINYLMTVGFIGLFYTFSSWQQIPYLSSPVVFIIIIIVFFYFLIYNIMFWKNKIKPQIKQFEIDKKYTKYLPNKKTI